MDDAKDRAEARLDAALDGAPVGDPRPYYRAALIYLREHRADAFQEALRYFQEELIPAVAGEADPLDAWLAYGETLARALGEGRTLQVDPTGRSHPVEDAGSPALILRLPDDDGAPALALQVPRELSAAQRATLELLVQGRQSASAYR